MPKKMADRTFKKGIAIAICIMMALSGSLILWNGNTEENVDTTPVIVYLRSPSDTQLLKARGVDVVESYGGFVLANLAEREMRFLKHQGFSVEAERELHTVALNGFTIDTRVGTPSLPSDLFIEAYPMGMDGRYIVQFIGPVKDEWTRTVTNLGAEVGNYLPNNAFIVNMNEETKDIVSRLRFVQWVDVFQPAYKIRPELWDKDDSFDVKIITYEGKGANSVLARLTEEQTISAYVGEDFGLVRATVDTSMLPMLANIPGVSYVEPLYEIRAYNSYMQWTVQTNRTDDEKMFDMGLDGTGQLIALADTGVDFDHPAFRHDAATITIGDIYNVTDMTRRKVVRYMPMASYVGLDPWVDDWAFQDSKIMPFAQTMGHGTMMAGIAVANDDYMDISPNDGAAMGAKLIVQDVANVCQRPAGLDDCFSFIPDDYDDFFGPVYDEGARIHTHSWGTPEQTYDLEARMVDEFVFGHTDMFITWSAGNGGPLSGEPHTVGSPANAKGVVSLGWVGSPSPLIPTTQYNVNGQGSTGPTPDNRMKPELVNLGEGTSTISDGNPWSDLYRPDDLIFGTSYGAPATAGMAAIIRQYYEEGYYPTGTAHPASATNVSAAMVKALLMASGERCTEGFRDSVGEQQWPNNSQGWGRPLLDNVLYFPGDPKKTISVDHTAGLITGDVVEYNFTVLSNSEPLRVMLVWSDYPGTLGAATVLVNDLDLEVTDPLGNAYKGNVFSIPFATSQSRTGGGFDHENPTEGVHRWYPTPGVYNVKITGFNVPRGPQPFALVMNADIDTGFGQIMIDRAVYSENDIINIEVMDTNLVDDGINNKAYVTSTTEDVPETVNLTETEVGSGIWTASITTAFGAPYENNTLEVSDKDTITAWYDDPDPIHTATAHAVVDAAGPIITDVFVRDITNAAATVTWVTDEPSDSTVYWGETSALGTVTHDPVLMTYHEVDLLGLSTGVQYFFDVQSADWLGHSTLDDNGGVHYTFSTTEKAEILLVIGDGTFPSGKIPYWRNAIMYGGWSFNEYYVARTGDPDLSVLQRYKVVAWQTGFEQ
ncbi:MAG: S8 family serine peptidase [Methanobacteriota archaeon]|nr:MAG: S8 family serine peptidase [Euryarchaeota archaeon]